MNNRAVGMRENRSGTVPFLSFPLLDDLGIVTDAFSTREGGVSQGIYATLNFAMNRTDDPAAVRENYKRMAETLGVTPDKMVLSHQTHTTNIRPVTLADAGKGVTRPRDYEDVDGLVTDVPGLMLVTSFADCVPLYFVDPVRRAIALSHSGWRGTVNRMGQVTVERMRRQFGSRPEDLFAAIGPCICKDCYEVDETVAEGFRAHFPEKQIPRFLRPGREGHYQLDLPEANRLILEDAGILPEHLAMSGLCTCCEPERFFSHRASHGQRGNLCAFLMLRATA